MLPALALAIPAAISAGQAIAGAAKTSQANKMPLEVPAYYNLFRQDMERRRRLAENGNMMGGTLDAIRNVMGYGTQAVLKGGNVGAANFATRRSASMLNQLLANMQQNANAYTQMGYQAGDQAAKIGYQNQAWQKAQKLNQGQELLRAGIQNGMATAFEALPFAGVPKLGKDVPAAMPDPNSAQPFDYSTLFAPKALPMRRAQVIGNYLPNR